jgi:hypothetical protein
VDGYGIVYYEFDGGNSGIQGRQDGRSRSPLHSVQYLIFRQKKVARWLPHTTWVCIGDSTQRDPEASVALSHSLDPYSSLSLSSYASFYKQQLSNPQGGRVARIWIHKGLLPYYVLRPRPDSLQ